MGYASLLETTAEVSVAFAGFISIFLVLARRGGSFAPDVSLPIRTMVFSSVGCVFYAALPLVFSGIELGAPLLWQLSSLIILVVGAAVTTDLLRRFATLSHEHRASVPLPGTIVSFGLTALAFLAHLNNAVGWPSAPSGGVYTLGVWAVLGIAATMFVNLVFRRVL